MAQRTRQVTLLDVGVQIMYTTVAYGLHKIVEVIATAGEGAELSPVQREGGGVRIAGYHQITFLAFKDHASSDVPSRYRLQTADLDYERLVTVFVMYDLCIGRVCFVLETEPATVAEDSVAQPVHSQTPASNIHLMETTISQLTVPECPLPLPVEMEICCRRISVPRRPQPKVVI